MLGLAALARVDCILDTVDLRSRSSGDAEGACGPGERRNPASLECEACLVLPPPPGDCLCAWGKYRPLGFPYCDVADAYYPCLTCQGSIFSCNDLAPGTTVGQLGVTGDCDRIRACCDELASVHPGRAECCPCGSTLLCELDLSDPERAQYIVRCDPVPSCTPACPYTETCNFEGGCFCEVVPP
jgi:hypothetical protein